MALVHNANSIQIREVWAENLEEEFELIRSIVDQHPYIAMDTEFPGVAVNPVGDFTNLNEQRYQSLRYNADLLKLIQLGLTFCDEQGNLPSFETDHHFIWQFNFREFNPEEDPFADDSIQLLRNSGIDLDQNREKGISAFKFAELLMSSGVVLNDDITWITFHGGYDFAYLMKALSCRKLPATLPEFYSLVSVFFPVFYDLKYLIRFTNGLFGGLNGLARSLSVERVGVSHQAGSDSLLTSCVFRRVKENYFNGVVEQYSGVLFGLSVD